MNNGNNRKNRLRRSMMFLNAQKPNLLKDPYLYQPDSLIFDLEDAVALSEKDAARFTLFHALRTVDYQNCEKVVRINGIDTPFWKTFAVPSLPVVTASVSPKRRGRRMFLQ